MTNPVSGAVEAEKRLKPPKENAPRAYDLDDQKDVLRLFREVRGYLHTCRRQHHGTDMEGWWFAIDAVEKLIAKADAAAARAITAIVEK